MRASFTFRFRLPGLNEIIDKARTSPFSSSKQKKTWTEACALAMGRGVVKLKTPVAVFFEWFEPNSKRDPDNIMAGQKYILDALVGRGFIPNDSQKEILSLTHRFHVDARDPRIEVLVFEAGEGPS